MRINTNIIAAGLALAGASAAYADIVGTPLVLTAQSSMGTAQFTVQLSDGTYNPDTGDFSYNRTTPILLVDDSSGRTIGRLDSLQLNFIGDPQINMGFALASGNADTTFTFTTAFNAFAAILNPSVTGAASMSITDTNNNGVNLTGNTSGPFAYGARFNGSNFYAQRIPSFSAGPSGSNNSTGFLAGSIIGPVTDQSVVSSFTLTAFDTASGTSVYNIVPAPGVMALLGLSGLALARRRR